MYVIREPIDFSFERAGVKGKLLASRNLTNKAEFLLIETETGHETTIIEHECDFVYYVLEGSGYFEINDTKETCTTHDLIIIPAGIKFTYKGKLKMLLVSSPMWNEAQEEVLRA